MKDISSFDVSPKVAWSGVVVVLGVVVMVKKRGGGRKGLEEEEEDGFVPMLNLKVFSCKSL